MGDVVDRRKYISYRTAYDFRKRFIGKFQELGIDLHIIIGNHDTYYKNTNEVNSMEELVGTDRFKIYSEPEIVEFDGLPILLMPWINANNYDKSIKAELNFYQLKFKGGKTKSVKNRIVRLEQALKKERNE